MQVQFDKHEGRMGYVFVMGICSCARVVCRLLDPGCIHCRGSAYLISQVSTNTVSAIVIKVDSALFFLHVVQLDSMPVKAEREGLKLKDIAVV